MACTTYILKSIKFDKYYIGQTSNLEKRLAEHNKGRSKSTKPYLPYELTFHKSFDSRKDAMKEEKKLKNIKSSAKLVEYINCN